MLTASMEQYKAQVSELSDAALMKVCKSQPNLNHTSNSVLFKATSVN